MSFQPVNLFVINPTHQPLAGVLVKIFDEAGVAAITEGITDATGCFACLLETQRYQVRCYKPHVTFGRPVVVVVGEPGPNDFELVGSPFEPPTSNDPRLCLAWGFFRGPDGAPAANVSIQLIARFDPLLLDGDAILSPERVEARTDKDGFMRVALIRFGQYDVTIEGLENVLRSISVPDQPNVNLPDLLFPVVASITFDPPGPYTLPRNQEITVTPVVRSSSGEVLEGTATADVNWRSSDDNVLGVKPSATTITLRGVGAGSAELRAERTDTSIIRIPNLPLAGVPVAVTVTG